MANAHGLQYGVIVAQVTKYRAQLAQVMDGARPAQVKFAWDMPAPGYGDREWLSRCYKGGKVYRSDEVYRWSGTK